MNDLLLSYSQCLDRRLVGGKAQRLADLHRAGINVPPGFAVSTKASEKALESSSLPKVDPNPSARVAKPYHPSPKQRKAFLNSKVFDDLMPQLEARLSDLGAKSYAVRSSSPVEDSKSHPYAGLFDSYLHIPPREVLGNVKRCMLSSFNDRAISYARQQGITLSFDMAVLIVPMVYGDYSGVVFTVSPIQDQMLVIEIVKGLCDKLVLGQVSPLRIHLSRESGQIIEQTGLRLNLTPNLLQSIYQASMEIEELFGTPQDIEFVIENDNVVIVQSRDIPLRGSMMKSYSNIRLNATKDKE
jgi:phosphoenolpyruvate synthase/pyruvate phosphate dikinase